MLSILMMLPKLATLDLAKINVIWNTVYGVIITDHDVTKKNYEFINYLLKLYCRSGHEPKFGNTSISIRAVIITSILEKLTQKNLFFFRVVLDILGVEKNFIGLKFYTSVEKGLMLNVRKFLGLIPKFVENEAEKLIQGAFFPPLILKRVNMWFCLFKRHSVFFANYL